MNYKISVPEKLNFSNIQSLVISFEEYETNNKGNSQIIFDLSNLKRVDTEGLNYIALLPFHLKFFNENILIVLPTGDDIILFLDYTNLLRFFFDNFRVHGYNCLEDLMFFKKRIFANKSNKKARIGLIKSQSFDSFLRNELSNLEKIISHSDYSRYFCMCFYELSKNIFEHSGETIGGFAFHLLSKDKYDCQNDRLFLTISDIGLGIKRTLVESLDLPRDRNDSFYIEEAIKPGITSTGHSGRGLGLYQVVNFLGEVQITSGSGQIKLIDGKITDKINTKFFLKGTSINIKIDI